MPVPFLVHRNFNSTQKRHLKSAQQKSSFLEAVADAQLRIMMTSIGKAAKLMIDDDVVVVVFPFDFVLLLN